MANNVSQQGSQLCEPSRFRAKMSSNDEITNNAAFSKTQIEKEARKIFMTQFLIFPLHKLRHHSFLHTAIIHVSLI